MVGKTIGYIWVSTGLQTTDNQKLAILEYSQRHKLNVDDWVEVSM